MNNKMNKYPEYPTLNEYKSNKIINVAAAIGIGVSAVAVSLDLEAGEKKPAKTKKVEKSKQNNVKDKIILLAANLGHKDFKVREKATHTLITLGKECVKKKDKKMSELLKSELEKVKSSKDPEVKQRVKKILLALTPPPPRIPDVPLDGDIAIAGEIAF